MDEHDEICAVQDEGYSYCCGTDLGNQGGERHFVCTDTTRFVFADSCDATCHNIVRIH